MPWASLLPLLRQTEPAKQILEARMGAQETKFRSSFQLDLQITLLSIRTSAPTIPTLWVHSRPVLKGHRILLRVKFICESRIQNRGMNLKPQNVMVALKLCSYPIGRPAMSIVAADLGLSPSEVHGAIKCLHRSRLLHGPEMQDLTDPNLTQVCAEDPSEPVVSGSYVRGLLPTRRVTRS